MNIKFEKKEAVHEDSRRVLIEITNGEFIAKQIKVIRVKQKGAILGNHYHPFSQFFYLLRGRAKYVFEDIHTKERMEIEMIEGDKVTIGKEIAHKAIFFKNNSITIEGNEESYTGPECDIKYEVKDG